jgi:hypothetical protein
MRDWRIDQWHLADDVLVGSNVRYVSKFSAPTYLDERPES